MKSPTVLQCDQCESETGTLVASELDITFCARIENARGRLACTNRETKPQTAEDNNKDETKDIDFVKDQDDGNKNAPAEETKENDDAKELTDIAKDLEDKDPDDNKDMKDKDDNDDDAKKTEGKPNEEDYPLINPPIADDTPLPEQNGNNNGDYTDEFEHPTDGLPAGSFRKHCTGCELLQQGKLLACDFCKRNNGNKRYTIALVGECKFFVSIDGTLRCDKVHSARL